MFPDAACQISPKLGGAYRNPGKRMMMRGLGSHGCMESDERRVSCTCNLAYYLGSREEVATQI